MSEATILIIDDVDASRDELVRMVESLGHRALSAKSGLEGVKRVRESRISLVLLDVVMPEFDGFKISAMLKAQPRFVPVMLLTALDDLESKRRGQAAGADDFLSKPVQPLELQIRIAAMRRIKSLTDALDEANRKLAAQAETDPLTGVPNRRGFEALFQREHERAQRYQRPMAVLMVDIDHFKRVNDDHGHAAGDALLSEVSREIDDAIRQSDHVGRLGGEEFAVLAPEVGAAGGMALAERLRRRIEKLALRFEETLLRTTVSVGGVAWDGKSALDPAELLKRADAALYQAKGLGRNRSIVVGT